MKRGSSSRIGSNVNSVYGVEWHPVKALGQPEETHLQRAKPAKNAWPGAVRDPACRKMRQYPRRDWGQ